MEGDDELLADMDVKEAPKRDEWMTTLPPERKVRPSFHYRLITFAFVISFWDLEPAVYVSLLERNMIMRFSVRSL